MPNRFRRRKIACLVHSALAVSLAAPAIVQAQDQEDEGSIEEVVVLGSYIRNSAFAQDTAMDTVTGEDLLASGAPNMSEYIRDLTYVQNVNVTSVVLGGQDGGQNNLGASFNLRGLGENSTLTLVDGVRTVDPTLATTFPEIAMERMEVVLDGGSALYGSDAVAGVVNLVPIKEYDGVRFRTFYQRPEDGANEQFRFSGLWGTSWDNGLSYVGSFEHYRQTDIMMYERPREFEVSSTASSSGVPGTFQKIGAIDPAKVRSLGLSVHDINVLTGQAYTEMPADSVLETLHWNGSGILPVQQHPFALDTVGRPAAVGYIDPSCGTYNEGSPGHGNGPIGLPSGTVHPAGFCTYEYSMQHTYAEPQERYNLYNSLTWEASDWLRFNFMLNNYYRYRDDPSTFASPNPTNARQVLLIPEDHPANPYGFAVVPDRWRVWSYATTNSLPDHVREDTARIFKDHYQVNRAQLKAEYDMSDTWTGYTYYSAQESRNMRDQHGATTSRLQAALVGRGGPLGDQYWNPFGTYDPRAPGYVAGVTENTRDMNNWLQYYNENFVYARDYLDVFETMATGEVFDLPAGPAAVAFGFQWRELEESTFQEPYNASNENFIWGLVGEEVAPDEVYVSDARALFAEVEVPIISGLDAKLAVRHEQFLKQGLETTTPKLSVRYEVLPELALRTSFGESFLAPTSFQTRPARTDENCTDMYSGTDELSGTLLIGGVRCASGNPNLGPEQAEITNFGFTWQPTGMLDGLELSMDYQQIEYTDRIRTLSEDDVTLRQFQDMLAATGQSRDSYDPTPGSPSRQRADTWLADNAQNYSIFRRPDGSVDRVLIQSANVAAFYVDLLDVKANYTWNLENMGTFSHRLNVTFYDQYRFEGFDGEIVETLGKQNARTNIAPPLPETKLAFSTNWFMDNHSASATVNWFSSIEHDAQIVDLFPYDGRFTAADMIDGQAIVDVRYAYLLQNFFNSEVTVAVGINNLLDEKPQLTGQIGGFESRLVNNWYRQFYVSFDWVPGG